jgi:hypothetical protein
VADPVCNGSGSLIARDFARGNWDGLASGQAIAQALGCPVIPASSINPTQDAVFNTGTPLIYYVLAEAQQAHQTLGCVGGSIVAQTFLQVLWDTPNSILHSGSEPGQARPRDAEVQLRGSTRGHRTGAANQLRRLDLGSVAGAGSDATRVHRRPLGDRHARSMAATPLPAALSAPRAMSTWLAAQRLRRRSRGHGS